MPDTLLQQAMTIDELRAENARLTTEKNNAKAEAGTIRQSLAEENAKRNKAMEELRVAKASLLRVKEILANILIQF